MKSKLLGIAAIVMAAATMKVAQADAEDIIPAELYPDQHCLALNIYYEARSSNLADMAATSDVVLNRVKDTRYPNTICEVVKQSHNDANGNPIRNKCQFSWYCDGKSDRPGDKDAWINAQYVAYKMLSEKSYIGISEGATHYHATYVKPSWVKDMQLVGRIGDHVFYRWE